MKGNTGQFGEYSVAAELCRRGWIATTFTRNMPGFDILALHPKTQKSLRIQVKTKKQGEWSLNAKDFLEFDLEQFEKGKQIIKGRKTPKADITMFVSIGENTRATDKFYIISNIELTEKIHESYKNFLDEKGGRRPKNPKTTHTAIKEKDLIQHLDNWELFERM